MAYNYGKTATKFTLPITHGKAKPMTGSPRTLPKGGTGRAIDSGGSKGSKNMGKKPGKSAMNYS